MFIIKIIPIVWVHLFLNIFCFFFFLQAIVADSKWVNCIETQTIYGIFPFFKTVHECYENWRYLKEKLIATYDISHYLYAFILTEILWSLSSVVLIYKIVDQCTSNNWPNIEPIQRRNIKNLSDAWYFSVSHLIKALSCAEYEFCS